jgi:hypothetical protein
MTGTVQIAGFRLTIVESDELPSDENGHCDPSSRTIFVRSGMDEDEKSAVIFHELGHFLWYRLFGNAEECNEEQLCRLCEFFSTFSAELVIIKLAPDSQEKPTETMN